jgi:hypothetical protein
MKCIFLLPLIIPIALTQIRPAGLSGTVMDADTQKPIAAAIVRAVRSGLPPVSRNTRSGADGAYQIENLPPGT